MTTAKTSVRAEVQARSRGLYDVTFVPQEISPHFVNITFNDQDIKESPFECKIVEDRKEAAVRQVRRHWDQNNFLKSDFLIESDLDN